jgi:hypothetical protein
MFFHSRDWDCDVEVAVMVRVTVDARGVFGFSMLDFYNFNFIVRIGNLDLFVLGSLCYTANCT